MILVGEQSDWSQDSISLVPKNGKISRVQSGSSKVIQYIAGLSLNFL